MKKIFIIFSLLFYMGCQQSFLDIPIEIHTYYYTSKELFEKRITHYSLEGKYLFTYKIEDFTNYILLDGKNELKKNHIYWKFERSNYFEKLNFIKDLNPDEVFILFEGLELEEKLELLEKLDGKIKNYKRPIKNYLY